VPRFFGAASTGVNLWGSFSFFILFWAGLGLFSFVERRGRLSERRVELVEGRERPNTKKIIITLN
jgi:hypothetical protein